MASGMRGAHKWQLLAVLLCAGLIPIVLVVRGAAVRNGANQAIETAPLFEVIGQASATDRPQRIRLDRYAAESAMRNGHLPIALPDGTRYQVKMEREELGPHNNWSVIGHLETPVGALAAVITFGRDGVFGVLPRPDGRMMHITTNSGISQIAPAGDVLPPGARPDQVVDYQIPRDQPTTKVSNPSLATASAVATAAQNIPWPSASVAVVAPASSTDVTVDVLAVYTDNLVTKRGSASAAETEFVNLVAIANQAHSDSGSVVRLRIVGMKLIAYPESATNNKALQDLTNNSLPDQTNILQLRDSVGADLVALLRPYNDGNGSCGLAWLNGGGLNPQSAFEGFGYSVSNVDPCGPLVLAHELGHNMGEAHDLETQTQYSGAVDYGAYPFSFGYRQWGPPGFATVMAYAAGQPWIGYYSNPQSMKCGVACGVAERADNVRSINLMASRIARFRNTPNTIAIDDAQVNETNSDVALLVFSVNLSSPAPAGGVSFDIATSDGSATSGIDYEPLSMSGQTIPEGARSASFFVRVKPDTTIEPNETVRVALTNVTGMAVYDAEAVGTILNDDPRVQISGRLRFPAGTAEPSEPIWLYAVGVDGQGGTTAVQALPPTYEYRIDVVDGSLLKIDVVPPAPFVSATVDLGIVHGSMVRDINIERGMVVAGRIEVSAGQPALTAPLDVQLVETIGGVPTYYSYQLTSPNLSFTRPVTPGARVRINVYPPSPYVTQTLILQSVTADVEPVIELKQVPSLFMWTAFYDLPEGQPDTHGSAGIGISLSAPAPAGGVRVDLATVNGTAQAGSDYTAYSGTIEFAPGETFKSVQVEWFGDSQAENDETFSVVASNVSGATLTTPQILFRIIEGRGSRKVPGDISGDGRSELLWHSRTHQELDWWVMQGTARFGAGANNVPAKYQVAARGDLTGDGREDLVWRDDAYSELWLWRAQANGGYAAEWIGTHPDGDWTLVSAADIDSDGRADLLWQSISAQQLDWWRMNGVQRMGAGAQTLSGKYRLAAKGDFDGDGREDLVWRDHTRNELWLWRSQSTSFEPTWIGPHPGDQWRIVGAGDVSADRRADLFWHDMAHNQVETWVMDGAQPLTKTITEVPAGYEVATTGDFDGDNRVDLVWRDQARTELRLGRAGANGSFSMHWISAHPSGDWSVLSQQPQEPRLEGSGELGVYAADRDGDGRSDLLWHSPTAQLLDWWLMSGSTRRAAGAQFVPSKYRVAAKGDLNGDGREDIVWRDLARTELWLWQAQVDGSYSAQWIGTHPGGDWELLTAVDVNGDGRVDLLWQSRALQEVNWWHMDGSRRSAVFAQRLPGKYRLAATGDFDGDRRADIVWRDQLRSEMWLWRANGNVFEVLWIGSHPAGDWDIRGAGDANGDGRADLVWHSVAYGQVDVWAMQAAQRTDVFSQGVPSKYRIATTADFDADGRTDLIWRDVGRSELWLWRAESRGFSAQWVGTYPGRAY